MVLANTGDALARVIRFLISFFRSRGFLRLQACRLAVSVNNVNWDDLFRADVTKYPHPRAFCRIHDMIRD